MAQTGKLLSDDSGHLYLVPLFDVSEFSAAVESGDDNLIDDKFDQYRLYSHLSSYIVTLEEET